MGFTETKVLSALDFLNTTLPFTTEKIEWSLPIPTFSPGKIFVPLCLTIKDFVYFVRSRNFKIFKSLALNKKNTSLINNKNLGIKNLFSDLGIFLIEK